MSKLTILLLVLPLVASSQQGRVAEGAWLRSDIKWSKAPKEINPKLQYAPTGIIYFGADHTFALVYATVNRVPDEYEVISNGDGQEIYLGTWNAAGSALALKYRLVERTVRLLGEALPGPTKEETARQIGSVIVFRGHSFRRSSALDQSAHEFVAAAAKR
jgi:hypothetical protein